ncbi:MAG: hypothetical protein WDN28_33625 [Chthoniobacter sp.]
MDRVARCIELGAEDYLPKPVNCRAARARLGACLEKKRFRDHEQAQAEELLRRASCNPSAPWPAAWRTISTTCSRRCSAISRCSRFKGSLPPDALPNILEAERGATRAQELTRYLLTFAEGGAPIKDRCRWSRWLRDNQRLRFARLERAV